MRDPELVFKAQLAASALERAWQRWREMHGLIADPMPAISSYVGYSLEEPWGQPRVVFGLSAKDAEQLSALLNRHDCIGPVHATIAGQQGRDARLEGAPQQPGEPRQQSEQRQQGELRPPPELRQQGGAGLRSKNTSDPDMDSDPGRVASQRRGWIAPPGRDAAPPVRDKGPLDRWIGPHGNDTGPLGRDTGPLDPEVGQPRRRAGRQDRETGPRGQETSPQGREIVPQAGEVGPNGRETGSQDRGTGQPDRALPLGPGLPLPVPPQAPYFIAEQSSADDGRSLWRSWRPDGGPDELDGPVYRQIARAAREAAEANDAGQTSAGQEKAEQGSAEQGSAEQGSAKQDAAEQDAAEQPATGQAAAEAASGAAVAEQATGEVAAESGAAVAEQATGEVAAEQVSGKAASESATEPAAEKPVIGLPAGGPSSKQPTSAEPSSDAATDKKTGTAAASEPRSGTAAVSEPKGSARRTSSAAPTDRPAAAAQAVAADAKPGDAQPGGALPGDRGRGQAVQPAVPKQASPASAATTGAAADHARPAKDPGQGGLEQADSAGTSAAAEQVAERPDSSATAAKGAGKRPKLHEATAPTDNAHPESGSAWRDSEKKDDSEDDYPGPGGSGGARPTRSNTAARSRKRTRSRAGSSPARFEAKETRPREPWAAGTIGTGGQSVAEGAGRSARTGRDVQARDEYGPAEARPGEAQDADTRAVDAWADEIVRSSHGTNAASRQDKHAAEDDPAASKDSTAGEGSWASKDSADDDSAAAAIHPAIFDDEEDDGPGPLTLAASAARIEAEARIRAAMMQARASATYDRDSSYDDDEARPEATDSGHEKPEIAMAWGGPALTIQDVSESDLGPLASRPEDFDDEADDDPESHPEERSERSLSGYVRRSRITRGYSIPRLSKSKRPGAVPGL